jgi:hypothetical protein
MLDARAEERKEVKVEVEKARKGSKAGHPGGIIGT